MVAPRGVEPSTVLIPGPWTHRSVSANGIRLHVAEYGEGPLVVLLHGFPEFWWAWRHQLVALGDAGYRAVAVDLRGYGDTDKPPRGYDLWTLAGDVAGLIPALGERVATIVGQGWGGLIGWTVTALHPRLVGRLAVVAAPHPRALRAAFFRDLPGQGRALSYVLGYQPPRLPEHSLRADGGAKVERILRAWSGPEWTAQADFAEAVRHNCSAIRISTVAHCSMEYYRWAFRSQFRAEGRRFAAAVARRIEVPVLQIEGGADPCLRESAAGRSRRWVDGPFERRVLPGAGHFVHEERPAVTTELLVHFLKG